MTNTEEIANTILKQLGGLGRIRSMIGSSMEMAVSEPNPGMKFNFKGSRKANLCQITLDSDDTYTVQLYKFNRRTYDCPNVLEIKGVYASSLVELFEEKTKLRIAL